MKYETYYMAIGSAIANLLDLQHSTTLQILVLGAGRGPLVTAAINAVKQVKKARYFNPTQMEEFCKDC